MFFTDTHIRGTTPKNRKDNLLETLEEKFKEILNLSKDYDVDFILHGGDLFDRPDISTSIARKFALILSKFTVPIYLIPGNHDMYGHNPNTINRTMLGLLDAINIINLVGEGEIVILEKDHIKVQLTGQPYVYDIDSTANRSSYLVKDKLPGVNYSIHMVHGMLLDKPFIKGIPFTLIDDIKSTNADITLAGHYHSGFGVINIDGKYFINPGSVIRITNSLREIERHPKVVIIDLKDTITIDLIPLKTAKEGLDILDRKQIEISLYRNEKVMEFKQSIDSVVEFEKLDINHILDTLSSTEGISVEVKKEAMKRIAIAQMNDRGDELDQ